MASDYRDWYQQVLPELTGQGLWLRGGELNTLPPAEYDSRPLRVLFMRLSTWHDTGDSFTHLYLYQIAARTEGVFPDLGYLPPEPDAALFGRDRVPWALGAQTKRGPDGFDVIGLSNSIVQEIINIPTVLSRSGIPPGKRERLGRPDVPLLILGGANALHTSALWDDNPLVDAVFVGEDDRAIRRILEVCREGKLARSPKAAVLARLEAEVPGLFQPERLPAAAPRASAPDLDSSQPLEDAPVPFLPDRIGKGHLQISEGCPCFCSFCAEGWQRKPYRERSPQALRDAALRIKAAMGLDTVDIYSFNFNMHSGISEILWDLVPLFHAIGLKSQRFDFLAHDPGMAETLHALEKTTFTCGLEGISPRLRRYLHKNLADDEIDRGLAAILRTRPRELKVFLVATGKEEEEDFDAFGEFLKRLREILFRSRAATRVIFSVTPLVRFPWTPLEFEEALPVEPYRKILEAIAARVRAAKFEHREAAGLSEYWVSQVLARAADPRILKALLRAAARTRFVYYRRISDDFRRAFEEALGEEGLRPADLLRGFTLEESLSRPWARVPSAVRREFLWEAFQRGREWRETDYCFGRSWARPECARCGACRGPEQVRKIVGATQPPGPTPEQFRRRRQAAKAAETPLRFLVSAGAAARGVPRKALGVALARALMLSEGRLTPLYRGYGGSLFDGGDAPSWVTGADVITLVWQRPAAALLDELLRSAHFLTRVDQALGGWGRLVGFAPESWLPGSLVIEGPFEFDPSQYLRARALKHALRRSGPGECRCDFTPEALRKKALRGLSYSLRPGPQSRADVSPGPKFDVEDFVYETFRLPSKSFIARLRIESLPPS